MGDRRGAGGFKDSRRHLLSVRPGLQEGRKKWDKEQNKKQPKENNKKHQTPLYASFLFFL
jgi:hypothetical protein